MCIRDRLYTVSIYRPKVANKSLIYARIEKMLLKLENNEMYNRPTSDSLKMEDLTCQMHV